jgi:hypothetical protein
MLADSYEVVWNGARNGPGGGYLLDPSVRVSSPVAQPLRVSSPGVRRRPLRRPSVRSLVQTYLRSVWPLAVTHAVIARHVGHDVESVAYAAWVLRGEGVIEVDDVVPSRTSDGRPCRSQIRLRLTDDAMGRMVVGQFEKPAR